MANRARNNLQKSLRDFGPDSVHTSGDPIEPVIENPNNNCAPLASPWVFSIGDRIGGQDALPFGSYSITDITALEGFWELVDVTCNNQPVTSSDESVILSLTANQPELECLFTNTLAVPIPPVSPQSILTLQLWGLVMLAGLLLISLYYAHRGAKR